MTSNDAEEEYDELDDLLDEDPSKLETGATEEPSEDAGKQVNGAEEVDDPEVKEMMGDLQKEFSNLMKDGGVNEQEKAEQAENFQKILGMLGEASRTPGKSVDGSKEPQGFKNVVSKTLDRLKENGSKVDSNLAKEEKQKNTDDVLSQLLDQLVESGNVGDGQGEEGVDNAILQILNQMSSKEVLYQPMKEMHAEFTQWLQDHSDDDEHSEKIDIYKKQYHLVGQIIAVFENDAYTNEAHREQITNLLDELEQLGDSPVSKGFNNANEGNEMDDLAKMLEIDGDDKNLGNLDKELQDTCKQQ